MKSVVSTIPVDLRMLLHAHIRREDEERHPYSLHASQITQQDPGSAFCPREAVFRKKMGTPARKESVQTAMAVTWAWGHKVEDVVRDWLADMGRAVGDWKCKHKPCGTYYRWQTKPKACAKCAGDQFEYRERRAWVEASGITSSTDLFVNVNRPKLRLLEIKSIDKDKFAELKGPLAEHRARTSLYLEQAATCSDEDLRTRVDHEVGTVLYVSKGGYGTLAPGMEHWPFYDGKFSPFKTYDIIRDDAMNAHYVDKGKQVTQALAGGPMPLRICPVITSKRAQACPVHDACFHMKD